ADPLAQAQAALEAAKERWAAARSAYHQAQVKTDRLWADLQKSAPRAFASPLTHEQAQKALPAGTLFVAFSVDEEQTHVFLLRAGDRADAPLSAYTLTVHQKDLQKLVERFRREVTTRSRGRIKTEASRDLFATLFPGEARAAITDAPRLLISPDGPLWEAPFA